MFYPRGTPSNEFIRSYSEVYDTVEIDATFYAMPSDIHVRAWRSRTPDSFLFSAKVPRTITHEKILVGDALTDMRVFLDTMSELGSRLGPLLLQFPYFRKAEFSNFAAFAQRLDAFLAELPGGFRYVVEVRNRKWLDSDLVELCSSRGVALAGTEKVGMPRPEVWESLLSAAAPGFTYLRWLGNHKAIEKITDKFDHLVYDYRDKIRDWIELIRALRTQGLDVFGYFNNHFAGHAPASIELFRALYRGEDPGPEFSWRRIPAPPEPPQQGELF